VTDERRQEIMRRQAEGMRAMTQEEMARRQAQAAYGAKNAAQQANSQAEGMRNAWRPAEVQGGEFMPAKPPPTLWERCKRWLRA
jgi:hypothetical protein